MQQSQNLAKTTRSFPIATISSTIAMPNLLTHLPLLLPLLLPPALLGRHIQPGNSVLGAQKGQRFRDQTYFRYCDFVLESKYALCVEKIVVNTESIVGKQATEV